MIANHTKRLRCLGAREAQATMTMREPDMDTTTNLLAEARMQWVATVDAIRDPLVVHDTHGRIVRANTAYVTLAGMGFTELIGRNYWDCFPRRAGPLPGCRDGGCMAAGAPDVEFVVPTGEIYCSRTFVLHQDGPAGPCALHLFENVTQSRRDEQQLQARSRSATAHAAALSTVTSSEALFSGEVETLARTVTEQVASACDVQRVNVWLFNADATALTCIDHFDASTNSHSAGAVLLEQQFRQEFAALKSASCVAAENPLTDPRTAGYAEGYLKPNRITSMLDTVVTMSGRHLGLLCLEHVDRPHRWDEDEIAFARSMAEKIAIAITNRSARLAEQAMRASELRFRMLFEQAPVGITESAMDGRYLTVNRRMCQITGYTEEELRARTFRDITHPDDLSRDEANLARLLTSQLPYYSTEKRYRRKDGSTVWVTLLVTPVRDASSTIHHLVTIVEDISERKRLDEALRLRSAALDAAANPIAITDRAGIILWANPAFTALTGYTADEAIGQNPRALLKSGVHPPAFYRQLWETILAGAVWQGEMTNRRKDGSQYTEEMTITPVRGERGEITHFVAIKRDLTADKAMQSRLLQAQKMETVGRLAGGVAHDFNNLLTVINGVVDLVLADLRPHDPLRTDLDEVRRAGQRARTLTGQLLAFSRQQVMQPAILSLNGLLSNLLTMLHRLIGEDITLVTRLAEDLGQVRADAGQLEQVIVNLAVNARDAMPTGGSLTFETRNVELNAEQAAEATRDGKMPPGAYVALSVRDTGVGMDATVLSRIFEPFFTTKEAGKGTGLGLSTVYGIVTQSGGGLQVHSASGEGTTFIVYLPRTTVSAAEQRRTTPEATRRPGTEVILVVDDEAALRSVSARILARSGYQVLTAANGEEALTMLRHHEGTVHLLLTDVVMPGMSGPELVERIQQDHPRIKILYSSGYTDDTVLRHGANSRVQFISKPYSIDELTRKVREVLDA